MLSSSCIQGARTRPSPLVGEKRNFWDSEKFYLRGIKTSRHLFFASTKSILTSRTLKIAKSWCREVLNRELVATAKNWCFTVFLSKNVGKSAFRSIWSLLYHLNTKHSSYRLETKNCCNTYETKHSSAPKLQLTPIAIICSCFISSTHSFFVFSFSYVSLFWCKISSLSQPWFSI